jgi:transcription-repair coupling factor (superfamily II helicase)
MDMQDELQDRFGDIPPSAVNLLTIVLIKAVAHKGDIRRLQGGLVDKSNWRVEMYFTPDAGLDVGRIPELVETNKPYLSFKMGTDPHFVYQVPHSELASDDAFLAALEVLVERIAECRLG